MRIRKNPAARRKEIIKAAISLSKKIGYDKINRILLSKQMGVSEALISYYFWPFDKLKKEVMQEAIDQQILDIIAQGIINRDKTISNLEENVKQKALAHVARTFL